MSRMLSLSPEASWVADRKLLRELKSYDAIVFSNCIPNALLRNYYDIETLRKLLPGKPIILYAVYYLGNAPSMEQRLKASGDYSADRFDWSLAVSEVTGRLGMLETD